MGGNKRRLQNSAEARSAQSIATEQQGAAALQSELQKRRAMIGEGLPETLQAARTGAANLAATGGITPENLDTSGRGYEGYQELATTGGFNPGEKEQFLRRASAPVTAMYGAARDDNSRRVALQGGYSPGFDASQAKITRQAANAGAESSLNANLDLNKQIREGKLAGLAGQERVKSAAEGERQSRQQMRQQGEIAGQQLLQNYSQFGVAALNETDVNDLRNRIQSGSISQADSQLLTQLAAQNRTLFENIMQGVSAVGGATAGVLTGVGGLTGKG